MRVLVTRPEPGATRTARRLAVLGHAAVVDPLMRIEPLTRPDDDAPFDALAFTSPNGVEAYGAARPGVPVFAVGPRTAEAARRQGWADVNDCGGDAHDLVRHLAHALPRGARVRHPGGADQAADLAALLAPHGIHGESLVVYRAVAASHFGPATAQALRAGALDAALHFSPRSARTFLTCAGAEGLVDCVHRLRHLCLSPAIAAVLSAAGCAVTVADAPNEDALLALLAEGGGGAPEVAPRSAAV